MAAFAHEAGVALRPHAKAHKLPLIARKQLELGAVGITCSKLGEAEVLVAGGILGILISSEIVGPTKIARLIALARHARLTIVVDDAENAAAISAAAVDAGINIAALVEVDVGQRRCGVQPGQPAVDLAGVVARLPGLTFTGLQGYEGHLQHVYDRAERKALCDAAMEKLVATRAAVEASGLPVGIVTTAGTGTAEFAVLHEGVTEIQPGSYIWMDCNYARVAGTPYESALSVIATVVSRQRPNDVIVDAGWKALSTDGGMPVALDCPDLTYSPAGDEHGRLTVADGGTLPESGDRVAIVPSHCDTTVNLYDWLIGVRNGVVETIWPIPGRGKTT
ncbi:MAG: DSD1 family PLP-dependent enzyme [Chloroflexota bacterium]|nr:MAG: DSD1 family PLP-dependent enzyme [Chloroflexota bacterium]